MKSLRADFAFIGRWECYAYMQRLNMNRSKDRINREKAQICKNPIMTF